MSQTETKHVSCPLVWEYDGHGEWSAISQVMDPDMTDEPVETWCREWALMWRIQVMEDGTFSCNQSDRLLILGRQMKFDTYCKLSNLQAAIDLAEDEIRGYECITPNYPVRLLPAETYNNQRRSL